MWFIFAFFRVNQSENVLDPRLSSFSTRNRASSTSRRSSSPHRAHSETLSTTSASASHERLDRALGHLPSVSTKPICGCDRSRTSARPISSDCCIREHHHPRRECARRLLATRLLHLLNIACISNFLLIVTTHHVDQYLLSVGQLQWMDYELFLPALRPFFLCSGLPPSTVDRLIKEAQHDLYYPPFSPSTQLHIAHASKRL